MLESLPSLEKTIEIYKLRANKSLGQHFLLDMNITDKIARLALPLNECKTIEVGPGPGGLTRSLLKNHASLTVIEMDDRFIDPLNELAKSYSQLKIIHGNALKVDLAKSTKKNIKLVSNLPYNIGTKLLINWLSAEPLFWSKAVLMFQKEVAQRITANPNDKAYGRLAILTQSVCDARIAFNVPAIAFTPPPKIDSAVVVFDPLPIEKRFPHLKALGEVTMATFSQRRKMLRGSLKSIAKKYGTTPLKWCELAKINPELRPENLSIIDFQNLVIALKEKTNHP